jgi:hypothetical protein
VTIRRVGAEVVHLHVEQTALTGPTEQRHVEHPEELREDRDDVDPHGQCPT